MNILTENIAAYLYRCFGSWKETSYYDLSEMNKSGWRQYAGNIIEIVDLSVAEALMGLIKNDRT